MIYASIASTTVYDRETRLERGSERDPERCVLYAFDTTGRPMTTSPTDPEDGNSEREVREDKARYEVPDLLSDTSYDTDPNAYKAFSEQAEDLHAAEDLLGDAWNLVGLMLTSVGETGDARDMQTEAGLKVIEEKLSKAHARIDEHHTHYTNLFLAYCDLIAGKDAD